MDTISDSVKSVQHESMGFLNYVFNFDTDNKAHMLNMLQYTLLTIIPVLLILRGIKHIIPEDDDSKGSLEILAESVGQVILIMLAIWFTNKIIQFIPTYSGESYPKFNETSFIIPFILILATMQTKLGAKFNILIDRFMSLITGRVNEPFATQPQVQQQQQGQGQNVIRTTQPLAGGVQQHQPSQADYLDPRQLLPSDSMMSAMPTMNKSQQPQLPLQAPYQMEPVAANEGGGFASW